MPSSDKLFRLDPVETKIVAPTTNFQVLAEAADQSIANKSLSRGLTAFSQALGNLAQFKKQQQIRDDIKTAKDAAVRGEVMPDVLPVAEIAYQNVIDKNTASESELAIERFENGDDFNTLVRDPDTPSAQKTAQLEAYYDDFYARAAQSMQNPDLIQNLRIKINGLKEKAYQKVYEYEKDLRTIEGIQGVSNIIKDAAKFAEATNVELTDTFTGKWLTNMVKDLGVSHPYIPEHERKLIVFQTLTANPDIINDPTVIESLMDQEFNKGFTYRNLYLGKGDDATEFKKIYDDYLKNVQQNFKLLEDNQKDADKERIANAKTNATTLFLANPDGDLGQYGPDLLGAGMTGTQIETFRKGLENYRENTIKEQRGSDNYNQVRDLVLAGVITNEVQLNDFAFAGNLAKNTLTPLKSYLTEEGNQRKSNVETYKKSVGTIRKTLVGLIKVNLKKKNDINALLLEGGTPSLEQLTRMLSGTNIDPNELRVALNEVNDLIVNMESTAESKGFADAAAEGDGSVSPDNIKAFQNEIQDNVKGLAERVNGVLMPGLEETPPTAKLKEPISYSGDIEVPVKQGLQQLSQDKIKTPLEVFRFNAKRVQNMQIDTQQRVEIQETIEGTSTLFMDKITNWFTKTKSEDAPDKIRDNLIVTVPRTPSEQKFYEQLKSGKNPSPEYKKTMKEIQQVPSRSELLAANPEAALRLQAARRLKATEPKDTGIIEKYNQVQDGISNSFSDLMDVMWEATQPIQMEEVVVEGAKPITDLPEDIQKDIKRQQEGKLPSGASEFKKSLTRVAIGESIKVLEPLIGKTGEENSLIQEETSGKKYPKMYLDSKKVPTIGIGFNLTKKGAKERIENLGYDYNKVLSGEQAITTTDINSLFVEDVAIAIDEAKSIFNKGDYDFNSLPNNVASVVTKMLFQLGIKRFKGFTSFIQAVKDGDYDKASKEILTTTKKDGTVVKSKFHKQVPKRANRLAQQIKGK